MRENAADLEKPRASRPQFRAGSLLSVEGRAGLRRARHQSPMPGYARRTGEGEDDGSPDLPAVLNRSLVDG